MTHCCTINIVHPLVQWPTKCESQNPGHSQDPFRSKQFSYHEEDILCLLHCVDICNDNAKAMMGEIAGTSAQIKVVEACTVIVCQSHSVTA